MNKKVCDHCKKELTQENTPNGVNGYEVRTVIPEAPNVTKFEEVCKSCYLEEYKKRYPDTEAPKL